MKPSLVPAGPALRIGLGVLLVLVVCAGVAIARLWPQQLAVLAGGSAAAVRSYGLTGWLVAALVQLLIALCGILPASVGAITAGMAFGTVEGFLLSGGATIVGAILAFLLSQSLLRPLFAKTLARRPRIRQLDEAVARDGWRLVALLRVSPIMPFAMTSYALGLTSLSLRDYAVGTIASLPALLGYVVLGALASAGLASLSTGDNQPLHLGLLGLAIVATLLLTLRLARIVRSVMRLPESPLAAAASPDAGPGLR